MQQLKFKHYKEVNMLDNYLKEKKLKKTVGLQLKLD